MTVPDPNITDDECKDFTGRLENRYTQGDMAPSHPERSTRIDLIGYTRWESSYVVKRQNGMPHEEATQAVIREIDAIVGGNGGNQPGPGPGPAPIRKGITRIENRVWIDDLGPFRPFGHTMMWTITAWRRERERLFTTWEWFRQRGVEYTRDLGDVSWAGQEIDSTLPDYEQVLGEIIDTKYAQFGLKTNVTVWGDSHNNPRDPIAAARRVAAVVSRRPQLILDLQCGNESWQNGPDRATLIEMAKILKTTGCLVSLTSPPGPGMEVQVPQDIADGATIGAVHTDRGFGERGERMVRQSRDFRDLHNGIHADEPPGPRASVHELTDPGKLALLRGFGIMNGLGAFVFHNANCVTGQPDDVHNRQGDPWSVPNVDQAMLATRRIDQFLPIGIETWEKTSQHHVPGHPDFGLVGPQPMVALQIWSDDGADPNVGCDRCYGAVRGNDFVTVLSDVWNHVDIRSSRPCELQVVDAAVGEMVQQLFLSAEQPLRFTTGDYLIVGRFQG